MSLPVHVLAQTYIEFQSRGLDPELIREEFEKYKSGAEFDHEWFCHDVGSNPREYLRHVHFIPSDLAAEAQWLADFADPHRKARRTSDRYVLYAWDPRHGYLIIDILDDPGAHTLWKQRHKKLPNYELAATNFCTYGPNVSDHK